MLVAFLLVAGLGGVLLAGLAMPAIGAAGALTGASADLFEELPAELEIPDASQQSIILDADGNRLATFYAENRIVVGLDAISPYMQDAVVAIEDKRFYEHRGIDVEGMARALVSNVFGEDLQGASTLTQQYVKNVLIESGRISGDRDLIDDATETSISRKLREAKLAITLEQQVSKEEILAGYLNVAQFGPAQYGVEAAANYYFAKKAADLNPGEAAMLARITQSPGKWDPVRNPENAFEGRNTVLREMRDQGYITAEEYETYSAQPIEEMLNVQRTPVGCGAAGNAAYFCDYVVQEILNNEAYGETLDERRQLLNRGGLIIRTTLERDRQQNAFDALTGSVPINDPSGIRTAISSIEPGTGRIVAMAQNTNYGTASEEDPTATQVNLNVGQSRNGGVGFQTGSTFKIFTLVQWLKEGHSLNDVVNADRDFYPASSWSTRCGRYAADYEPNNLDGIGGGYWSVLDSTRLSVNLSFVEMANRMDLCDIRDTAVSLGAEMGQRDEEILPVPGMILGSNNLTPLSMSNVVATLAAGGVHCEPVAITEITTRDGEGIAVPPSNCTQVLEPRVAAAVTYAMDQVVGTPQNSTGFRADIPGRVEAGKTGTANRDTAAWFVGFTPQLSAAVWMGHQEGTVPMQDVVVNGQYYQRIYGGMLPAPTWRAYMEPALAGEPALPFPSAQNRYLFGSRATVPDVIGQGADAAAAAIQGAGLTVQVLSPVSSDVPEGMIASMSPGPGARVVPGAVVQLAPSSGPAEVQEESGDEAAGGDPAAGEATAGDAQVGDGAVPPVEAPGDGATTGGAG